LKVLAIDYGLKRVGIALGDTELKIAVPKEVVPNDGNLLKRINELVTQHRISKIVVGLPLTPSGKEGERAKLVREFVRDLKEHVRDREVILWDERYTTLEAKERLKSSANKKRNREILDAISAQIILEEFLTSS